MDDPLTRIQREISEVVQREHELRNQKLDTRSLSPDDNNNNQPLPPLQRAKSTSHLAFNQNQRGLMQRFIKSRGRLSLQLQPNYSTNAIRSYSPPRSQPQSTKKMTRKGYIPVEERIQRELREMQDRETELRIYRSTSMSNLLAESPPQSFSSVEPTIKFFVEQNSASFESPPKDEEEEIVPKSKNLIAKFEWIIQQNKVQPNGVPNGNHL